MHRSMFNENDLMMQQLTFYPLMCVSNLKHDNNKSSNKWTSDGICFWISQKLFVVALIIGGNETDVSQMV